jgi:dolichol-phosphate mannosyltransferase
MQPFLSVVLPLYNEQLVLEEMHKRLTSVLEPRGINYEILLVNDGSKDRTLEIAKDLTIKDSKIKVISFSRNFGHQIAITAGMDRSVGEVVVIIDADLQDPPEVIVEMIDRWKEGYQVVYAKRRTREGEGLFKKITAALFYRILEKLTPIDIPVDTGDFRLLDRKVVTQLIQMREKNRFVRGMVSWVGFKQCKVEYEREKRFAGETKYPLRKMLRFAMDGILSFSQVPLKISSFFGFVCAGISFLLIIYGLVRKAFFPEAVIIGWASTFVTVLFLGGVQLISVGILGEYLGRMYDEIKGRPLYIIDEEINFT